VKAIPSHSRRAFTLIELMVAIGVLLLLVVFIAQINGTIATTIRLSNQKNTTDSDARLALGCLGQDIQNLVKRSDVDFLGGNPSVRKAGSGPFLLLFLSKTASAGTPAGGNRKVSLIGYQIGPSPENGNRPCLLRGAKAVGWANAGFMGLGVTGLPVRFDDPSFSSALLPSAGASPSDFDVLAPGVIRLVVAFQLYPDNQQAILEDGTVLPAALGQWVYSPPVRKLAPAGGGAEVAYADLSRVSAVGAGIVVVDRATLKLLDAAQVARIAGHFPVPPPNQTPLQAWKGPLNGIVDALAGSVPLAALQSVRTYECVYPVTPAATLFGE